MLDIKDCTFISQQILKLTTNGEKYLNVDLFKQLISCAGTSVQNLKFCKEKLLAQLNEKHSEIKFGSFLVIEELFMRSEYFRDLLLEDFHLFLDLTIECKKPPPPLETAKNLKLRALQAIQKWHTKFGKTNTRIILAYNYIKNTLKIDFEDAELRNTEEILKAQIEEERREKVRQEKLSMLEKEMSEHVDEISRIVTEMSNCFHLIVPKPSDIFNTEEDEKDKEEDDVEDELMDEDSILREHGLNGMNVEITFNLNKKLEKNEDNEVLIENWKDSYNLAINKIKMVKKWSKVMSTISDNQELFKKIMDIQEMLENEIKCFENTQLNESIRKNINASESDSDNDSDFEDVPEKEGYEEFAISTPVSPKISEPKNKKIENINASHLSASHNLERQKSNEKISEEIPTCSKSLTRKEKLLKIAPKIPYGSDLDNWTNWSDKANMKAPTIQVPDKSQIWVSSADRDEIEVPDELSYHKSRIIEFSGKFEPIKWSCRTPLPSGRLCPRKDRDKCPLHGKIIPRNENGEPSDEKDILELKALKEKEDANKPPEWQDPEFLKDLKAEIGIDLTITKNRKKKGGKKKYSDLYPGLTDIQSKKETPRMRLKKKIFNKGTMKRVNLKQDIIDSAKDAGKFSDQFNYTMQS